MPSPTYGEGSRSSRVQAPLRVFSGAFSRLGRCQAWLLKRPRLSRARSNAESLSAGPKRCRDAREYDCQRIGIGAGAEDRSCHNGPVSLRHRDPLIPYGADRAGKSADFTQPPRVSSDKGCSDRINFIAIRVRPPVPKSTIGTAVPRTQQVVHLGSKPRHIAPR